MIKSALLGTVAVMLGLGMTLAGCAGAPNPQGDAPAGGSTEGFPVTVTHAQGSVTVETPPQRVVTLGSADTQLASALGLSVVAAVRDPSSEDGNWPGVEPGLAPEITVLDSTQPNLEQIASFDPDLILATSAQPAYTEQYAPLSQIAPVISYQQGLLQDSGEDLARLIGSATGTGSRAEELISSSDTAIAEFANEFGDLEGKSYVFGQYAGGTTYLVASPEALSSRFFARVGMQPPESITALWDPGDQSYAGSLGMITPSAEQLGIMDDADVALISAYGPGAEEEFTGQSLIKSSRLLAEDRLVIIDQGLAAPLLQPNPATTELILAQLAQTIPASVRE